MKLSIFVNDAGFMGRISQETRMEAVSERPAFVDSSIPIEIVDDDELAAIETAFFQATSSVQCSLPRSKSCAHSLAHAPPLQRSLSLAESASGSLMQCLNVKDRVNSLDTGTCSKSLLEVHSISSSCSSSEISLPSTALKVEGQIYNSSCCEDRLSIKCCSSHEMAALVSSQSALDEAIRERDDMSDSKKDAMRITAQAEHPLGQTCAAAIPVVQDIEDLPSGKDAVGDQKETVPPEPKPRCLSVTDFTAFVRSLFIVYLIVIFCCPSMMSLLPHTVPSMWYLMTSC